MSSNLEESQLLPNGDACAAFLAAGVGACAFGVLVASSEASSAVANALNFISPVGPLSGKVAVGLLVWLAAWGGLHLRWARRQIDSSALRWAAPALLLAGFALTFPPVFELFAS